MSVSKPDPNKMDQLVDQIVASYQSEDRIQHLDAIFLPSRAKTIEIVELLRRIVFPGFFDEQRLDSATVRYHVGELVGRVRQLLYEEIRQSLRYEQTRTGGAGQGDDCPDCDPKAEEITYEFLGRLTEVRRLLTLDVQAAYDGDPAAANTDETIFCYPGIDAIFIYRTAHELYKLEVPMLPRIMAEYAHNETGIDIHPGATIDESFFIDHGTGVVIGQTCRIGKRVKVYQGVTLGALSTKGGQSWSGQNRHPTIEDDVTIYGGAIILGGQTVIGKGSVIGGSVFIAESVPPHHIVTMKFGELKITSRPVDNDTAPPTDAEPKSGA
jgi:serine O-acetyltransferase